MGNASFNNSEKSVTAVNDFFADRPKYNEGYDAKSDTIIRLCSPVRSKKEKKAYKVTGIDDVASKNNWKGWLYLAPALILVVVFLLYPLINTIAISFMWKYDQITNTFGEVVQNPDGSSYFKGFTLDNFGFILGLTAYNGVYDVDFLPWAVPNTLIIVFVTVPLSTLIALLISVALNSIKWLQKALQTVFFIPYVTNTIAVGMVFSVMFRDDGIINYIFNTTVGWLDTGGNAGRWIAMIPLCIYIVWSSLPFKILIFLSGLQGIDKQYYQAAKIDGASRHRTLWRITVPLMSPQILYIVITSFIGSFKEYSAIVGLFGEKNAGTEATSNNMLTIVYYIYQNLSLQTSRAAAAAVFLFVIILIFTFFQLLVSKKRVYY